MLTSNIKFTNFYKKNKNKKSDLNKLKKLEWIKNFKFLLSFTKNYNYSYSKKYLKKYKNFKNFRIIGMGGSILGSKAIYAFLHHKVKKNFEFIDNLNPNIVSQYKSQKKILNIIISKSGNTLETISNFNILVKNNDNNIIITEKKNNYLRYISKKIKSEVLEHKNFIGGRYSVLSEAGMLPAELMGLNEKKFKRFNYLISNNNFLYSLINNVNFTLKFIKQNRFNSIILNYDESSENLFKWYQQLISESLGKKSKGILPVVSTMPKDNHSILQLYLDGPKRNFFTFFSVKNQKSQKIKNKFILNSFSYLKNKSLYDILISQKKATERVFKNNKIPYRVFEIINRNEQALGEIFCFFVMETILLGRALNVNPFDQPSVELVKKETKKILFR
tara:strand:+ start:1944 stop:3113 length:1170 start_codon:yes stop_codon:yes gene_type:complete